MSLSVNARIVRLFAASAAVVLASSAFAAPQSGTPKASGAGTSSAKPAVKPIPAAAPPAPKLPANVFARVGNQDITSSDIVSFLASLGGYPLVQQRVQIVIAEQQARKYGVTVTPTELDKAVQEQKDSIVKSQMMQSTKPMTFNEIAAKQGISEGLIRAQTRFQLLLKKTYSKVVESNLPTLNGKVKISHLLISTQAPQPNPTDPQATAPKPEDAAKRDADALAKVKQIQADVASGKITWQDAIKQNSDDPSAKQNNGDLGWVGKDTQFVPEFLDAAMKLQKVGDIAGPVKTQYGYHLIRLDAKGSDATPAQKAAFKQEQLNQALNPQAIQGWFYQIARNANVTYNPSAQLAPVISSAPPSSTKPHKK